MKGITGRWKAKKREVYMTSYEVIIKKKINV